jgi:hypothetical protein
MASSGGERRYSEKETGEILRRAAERQAATYDGDPDKGLTLAEIQRVAGEVNISPDLIAAAAAEMDRPREPSWFYVPSARQFERVIDGELDEVGWEAVVAELRTAFAKPGEMSRFGSSYEWRVSSESGSSALVTATPRDGQTTIKLMVDQGQPVAMTWMIPFIGTVVVGGVLGKFLYRGGMDLGWVLLLVFAILVAISAATLLATRWWDAANQKRLDWVMDRVADRGTALTTRASAPLAQTAPTDEQRHVQA